jgi:hypothetical protein
MQKPENYKFPHLTTHPVMYLRINPATLLPSGGGGTLDGGQLIWTKKGFASDEEQLSALGFVEDFGMILVDPRWLKRVL